MAGIRAVLLVTAVAFVGALAGCGGGSSSSSSSSSSSEGGGGASLTGSGYPGVDAANTRHVDGQIDSSNVTSLEEAWTAPIHGASNFGSYASTPVIDEGVIYSQDLGSNVEALDLESGEVLWAKTYEQPDEGPNGVVVAGGMVFGATPSAAFALDQKTGEEVWSTELVRTKTEGIDMAPGYQDGIVYVSTVPLNTTSRYEGGGVGILWALDAKTGKKLWEFDTVPKNLWGKPKINSGGGVWYPPAFDEKGGIYFGVGNPAPYPGTNQYFWGSSRPGPNLYTNSLVKLNAKSGKLEWYHQVTPHDLYDWDFQGPPILIKAGGKDLVIAAGKSGIVLAADRETGKVVWQKAVGRHSGHDEDGLLAMRGEEEKIKKPDTIYPGTLGGVIAPMSTDGKMVFVPIVNSPLSMSASGATSEGGGAARGEIVALDAATGALKWKEELGAPAYGATTSVGDVVFATSAEGAVTAFKASNGQVLWRETLPAGTNSGVMANGDMLIAAAGLASAAGQTPKLVAYRVSE
ncbi:MAG TPA: PQQ-binding-like beta-propeller repeat protein [Solirubrobacterales bacterium]|nr:PQQ-binding-like beta-propeller repeat protein [Solirubrobacterales bacterium]